jgi:ribosomal protein L37AE/L43A
MAKNITSLNDLRETEWTGAIGSIVTGLGIAAGALILGWLLGYFGLGSSALLSGRVAAGMATLAGLVIAGAGLVRWHKARHAATVTFLCPYCDRDNLLTEPPTVDFDCEHCSRTIHFLDGRPVEVRVVTCQACRTPHRVAVTAAYFVCDRCNRSIALASGPPTTSAVTDQEEVTQDFDVLLVAFDRRRENELVFKLQNLLVVNMVEARRHLHSASSQTPLVVAMGQPRRKAEMLRRTLQELGATVIMRPTQGVAGASGRG